MVALKSFTVPVVKGCINLQMVVKPGLKLILNDLTGASEISMDFNNPNVLYAAMWEHQESLGKSFRRFWHGYINLQTVV